MQDHSRLSGLQVQCLAVILITVLSHTCLSNFSLLHFKPGHFSHAQNTVLDTQDVPAWGDACNFILFIALCIGCVFVWIGLIRAWISCCRLEDQVSANRALIACSVCSCMQPCL